MQYQFFLIRVMALAAVLSATTAQARVWRVNNTPGVNANFSSLSTAFAAAAAGDTLYIEGSTTTYGFSTLNKRLVLIGNGYLLSGPGANVGLQANTGISSMNIDIDTTASGSQFIGLSGYLKPINGVDDIQVIRCNVAFDSYSSGMYSGWKIRQCLLGYFNIPKAANCEFTNNICQQFYLNDAKDCLVRNNIFTSDVKVAGAYFANNILLGYFTHSNSIVKYNIASGSNTLPAGNNNQNGISKTSLFVGVGSADGFYSLAPSSPAIGAGEPINGETPDAGAFGTAAPYRLSGIPPIPTIYQLLVPASVPSTASSINITFSTRSNN